MVACRRFIAPDENINVKRIQLSPAADPARPFGRDSPNVGNHSVKLPINIGIAGFGRLDPIKGTGAAPVLDIDGLPVFTVSCDSGPLKGTTFTVTDLGRAMISGQCADIGKFKGPILRSLAARAPCFHNGSALTLADVVTLYDQRFKIGFTEQEKEDLAAFLASL